MRGYCVSCGMSKELDGGMCRQCREDSRVSRKRGKAKVTFPLTLDGIAKHARGIPTSMSAMFLLAVHDAMENGSAYGWK